MTKIDFKNITITGIEGQALTADFQRQLGNQLYMQGRNIEECELGKRIYFAEGATELNETECAIVKRFIQDYSYVARSAIEKLLSEGHK